MVPVLDLGGEFLSIKTVYAYWVSLVRVGNYINFFS